jgi:hypothetical protein
MAEAYSPLIKCRRTVLSWASGRTVGLGGGAAVGVCVGLGAAVGVSVAVWVGAGVRDGSRVRVGDTVGLGLGRGVELGATVGLGVGVCPPIEGDVPVAVDPGPLAVGNTSPADGEQPASTKHSPTRAHRSMPGQTLGKRCIPTLSPQRSGLSIPQRSCQLLPSRRNDFDKCFRLCYDTRREKSNWTLIQRGGGTGPLKPRQPVGSSESRIGH